jgi:hypothetical protein
METKIRFSQVPAGKTRPPCPFTLRQPFGRFNVILYISGFIYFFVFIQLSRTHSELLPEGNVSRSMHGYAHNLH